MLLRDEEGEDADIQPLKIRAGMRRKGMHFFDLTMSFLSVKWKLNHVISGWFFFALVIDILDPLFGQCNKEWLTWFVSITIRLGMGEPNDVVDYMLSPVAYFALMLLLIFLLLVNWYITTVSVQRASVGFVGLIYGAFPIFYILLTKTFTHAVVGESARNFDPWIVVNFMGHCVFVCLMGLMAVMGSTSPYMINHVFVFLNPVCAIIGMTYIVLITHFDLTMWPSGQHAIYIKMLASLMITCLAIVHPIYFSRLYNTVFVSISMMCTASQLLLATKVTFRWTPLFVILLSAGLSILIFYVLYHFKRPSHGIEKVCYCLFMGRIAQARETMETLIIDDIPTDKWDVAIRLCLALEVHDDVTRNVINLYRKYSHTTCGNMFLDWSALRCWTEKSNRLPPDVQQMIELEHQDVKMLERQFWRHVWLSHVDLLMGIACDIGRRRCELMSDVDIMVKRFPSITPGEIDPELMRELEEDTTRRKRCCVCEPVLVAYVLVASMCLIICALARIDDVQKKLEMSADILISGFVSRFCNLISKVGVLTNTTAEKLIVRETLLDIENGKDENPILKMLLDFTLDGQSLEGAMNEFIQCADANIGNFPVCESYARQVIDISAAAGDNRWDYTQNSYMMLADIYTYAVLGAGWLVNFTTFVVVITVALLKFRDMNRVFEMFLTVPKSTVRDLMGSEAENEVVESIQKVHGSLRNSGALLVTGMIHICALGGMVIIVALSNVMFLVTRSEVNIMCTEAETLRNLLSMHASLAFCAMNSSTCYELSSIIEQWSYDMNYDIYAWMIPDGMYAFLVHILMNDSIQVEYSSAVSMSNELLQHMDTAWEDFQIATRYSSLRSVVFVVSVVVMFAVGSYLIIGNQYASHLESTEGDRLLAKARGSNPNGETPNLFVIGDVIVDHTKLPVSLISANAFGNVIYTTHLARERFGLTIGSALRDGVLEEDTIAKMMAFIQTARCPVVAPGFVTGTVHMTPFYNIVNGTRRLQYVTALWLESEIDKVDDVRQGHGYLFHRIFPRHIPVDTSLPARIPSKGPNHIMIVRLVGFHDFASVASLRTVDGFRRTVSNKVKQECDNNVVMWPVSETGDTILLISDRKAASENPWGFMSSCFKVGRIILNIINDVSAQYEANVVGRIVVFKSKDPGCYATLENMFVFDARSNFSMAALDFERHGRTGRVTFAHQPGDLRAKSTALLRECLDKTGTVRFSLYLVL